MILDSEFSYYNTKREFNPRSDEFLDNYYSPEKYNSSYSIKENNQDRRQLQSINVF